MNLLDKVKEAGVTGAGGAGFPTHVKLSSKAEYILMNAAECEPLLRVDQQLMGIMPDEVLKGFEAAGKIVGADKAIIGIKKKHKEVIELLRQRVTALNLENHIEIKELADVYPAGDEQVLVYELTGRIVPEGGIPIQVGCVVVNTETVINIYNAMDGKAVTEKYITVAGDIPKRMTVKVPVGTPIIDVLKLSGIEDFEDYAIIDGGPMMGPVMTGLDGFVTKKNKGFIILKKDHPLIRKKTVTADQARRINKATCEQCRMCTDLCPRYLLGHNMQPHKMMRTMNYSLWDVEERKIAFLCCQCNLCELFACPADLYPRSANIMVRDSLLEQGIKYQCKDQEYRIRNNREYRLLPSKRLVARLGLWRMDEPAPFTEVNLRPDLIRIALSQHVGVPANPIVKVGDRVNEGQMIGKIPEGCLGAAIHASITGTVSQCNDRFIEIRRD
ncbi:MAG: 4Fe-4S dicluster domain-containing protein [Anaerovoracaceae bacterium]